MKKILVLFLFIVGVLEVKAQDALFSQFYAIPVSLNPALAGTYEGRYRLAGVYRDQWRSMLEEPFTSYGLGLDLKFNTDSRGISKDFFSAGIYFQSDRAGILEYTLNQMFILGSYHKSLDNTGTQFIGGGFQIGMNQRNINFANATFQDQFNGIDGYTLGTLELLPENNFAHSDFAAGISYINAPKKGTRFYAGVAVHHIIGINNSLFFRDPDVEIMGLGERYNLPMRITGHVAASFPTYDLLHIQPRAMFATQGGSSHFNVGTIFKFFFSNLEKTTMYLGVYYRGGTGVNSWAADTPGFLVGYGLGDLQIGMSYDFSVNALNQYGRSRGSFELSISYFGFYEDEDDLCPSF